MKIGSARTLKSYSDKIGMLQYLRNEVGDIVEEIDTKGNEGGLGYRGIMNLCDEV
jgi:hypothetical protein